MKTVSDVENFIDLRSSRKYSLSTVHVVSFIHIVYYNILQIYCGLFKIGFFSEHEDMEEDDYEDFLDTAKDLQVMF